MKFKKEFEALLGGVAFAYLFQLFILLLVYIENPESNLLTADSFIPVPTIMLAIVPMVYWVLMGFLRVSWFHTWLRITVHAIAFLFPFVMIPMIALYINARLWHSPIFWLANAVISFIAARTVFKPVFVGGSKK